MSKEEVKKQEQSAADTAPKQVPFVGTVIKLNDRTEEVVKYPKGAFTVEYLTQYVQVTELASKVITRLPYTSIHFIKEVQ